MASSGSPSRVPPEKSAKTGYHSSPSQPYNAETDSGESEVDPSVIEAEPSDLRYCLFWRGEDDDDDSDEDDESHLVDCDSLHASDDDEEFRIEYYQRLNATSAFDVDVRPKDFTKLRCGGYILPLQLEESERTRNEMGSLSDRAINEYNRHHIGKYIFKKVVKANVCVIRGAVYYITFEAEDSVTGGVEIFQARVFCFGTEEDDKILSCEIKSTN